MESEYCDAAASLYDLRSKYLEFGIKAGVIQLVHFNILLYSPYLTN